MELSTVLELYHLALSYLSVNLHRASFRVGTPQQMKRDQGILLSVAEIPLLASGEESMVACMENKSSLDVSYRPVSMPPRPRARKFPHSKEWRASILWLKILSQCVGFVPFKNLLRSIERFWDAGDFHRDRSFEIVSSA
jgi:hypothetical protein